MADVAINKRTVLVTNPASQQDFPGSTAPPVISPDVEVNFLELVDTPDTYTGQDGKFVRVKSTEDGLEFADVAGSKWTSVANGIYRDGRVAIGTSTVGTTYTLDVEGRTRLKSTGTNVNSLWLEVDSTDASLNTAFPNAWINLARSTSGGVQNSTGPGLFFIYDGSTSNRLAAFQAIKRGANTGEFQFITYNSSSIGQVSFIVRPNAGVYIGNTGAGTIRTPEANSLQVQNRIQTGNPTGSTARYWKLGELVTDTVALDTTRYLSVQVNGVVYKILVST